MVLIFLLSLVFFLAELKQCHCESKFTNFLISVDELKEVIAHQAAILEQHNNNDATARIEELEVNLAKALAEIEILKVNLSLAKDEIETLKATSLSHSSLLTSHVSFLP